MWRHSHNHNGVTLVSSLQVLLGILVGSGGRRQAIAVHTGVLAEALLLSLDPPLFMDLDHSSL
jgi:hypothetical protein